MLFVVKMGYAQGNVPFPSMLANKTLLIQEKEDDAVPLCLM